MKQIFLALAGVFGFILIVGFATQRLQGKNASVKISLNGPYSKKEITVGETKTKVEIADTLDKREKGLSGRVRLAENEGLLFIFDQKGVYPTFWMKGMLMPIDIIWIKDLKIAKIDKSVPAPKPATADKSLTLYYPDSPIDYVLEVNSGFSDKNNLKAGDTVKID